MLTGHLANQWLDHQTWPQAVCLLAVALRSLGDHLLAQSPVADNQKLYWKGHVIHSPVTLYNIIQQQAALCCSQARRIADATTFCQYVLK